MTNLKNLLEAKKNVLAIEYLKSVFSKLTIAEAERTGIMPAIYLTIAILQRSEIINYN